MRRDLASWADDGKFGLRNPRDPAILAVTSYELDTAGLTATVDTCTWDTGILYGLGAAPPETVVLDPTKASRYFRFTMYLENTRWLVGDRVEFKTADEEVNKCAG